MLITNVMTRYADRVPARRQPTSFRSILITTLKTPELTPSWTLGRWASDGWKIAKLPGAIRRAVAGRAGGKARGGRAEGRGNGESGHGLRAGERPGTGRKGRPSLRRTRRPDPIRTPATNRSSRRPRSRIGDRRSAGGSRTGLGRAAPSRNRGHSRRSPRPAAPGCQAASRRSPVPASQRPASTPGWPANEHTHRNQRDDRRARRKEPGIRGLAPDARGRMTGSQLSDDRTLTDVQSSALPERPARAHGADQRLANDDSRHQMVRRAGAVSTGSRPRACRGACRRANYRRDEGPPTSGDSTPPAPGRLRGGGFPIRSHSHPATSVRSGTWAHRTPAPASCCKTVARRPGECATARWHASTPASCSS